MITPLHTTTQYISSDQTTQPHNRCLQQALLAPSYTAQHINRDQDRKYHKRSGLVYLPSLETPQVKITIQTADTIVGYLLLFR